MVKSNIESRRLNTWKEIAHFFGKTERTVIRCEIDRKLPVHRLPGEARSRVFAYTHELENWLTNAKQEDKDLSSFYETNPVKSQKKITFPKVFIVFVLIIILFAFGFYNVKYSKPSGEIPIEAQNIYINGLEDWNMRTPQSINKAITEFQSAITIYPKYAAAYVGLANCYNLLPEYTTMSASKAFPLAISAAKKAIELDGDLADAHLAYAFALFNFNWDFDNSKKEFETAFQLDPNNSNIHHWYATSLLTLGEYDKALSHINRALEINPSSISIKADRGLILLRSGQGEIAKNILLELIQQNDNFRSSHSYLAEYYLYKNDFQNYLNEWEKSAILGKDDFTLSIILEAKKGYSNFGRDGMLKAILKKRIQAFESGNGTATQIAIIYLLLGDEASGLRNLELALSRRDDDIIYIQTEPAIAPYLHKPQFAKLVTKLKLAKIE